MQKNINGFTAMYSILIVSSFVITFLPTIIYWQNKISGLENVLAENRDTNKILDALSCTNKVALMLSFNQKLNLFNDFKCIVLNNYSLDNNENIQIVEFMSETKNSNEVYEAKYSVLKDRILIKSLFIKNLP